MRLMPLLAVAVGFGLVLSLFTAIGVSGLWGQQTEGGVVQEVQEHGNVDNLSEAETIEPEADQGFLTYVTGAFFVVRDMVAVVAMLPVTLQSLGLPGPIAYVVGLGLQFIIVLGLAQVLIQWGIR